jgi:hypothetical protein
MMVRKCLVCTADTIPSDNRASVGDLPGTREYYKAGHPELIAIARRSPEDFRLGQVEPHLQLPPLRCRLSSRRKDFAGAPPGMAIEDVPFKRAVRAGMPPYVEEHYRPQPSSASRFTPGASSELGVSTSLTVPSKENQWARLQ